MASDKYAYLNLLPISIGINYRCNMEFYAKWKIEISGEKQTLDDFEKRLRAGLAGKFPMGAPVIQYVITKELWGLINETETILWFELYLDQHLGKREETSLILCGFSDWFVPWSWFERLTSIYSVKVSSHTSYLLNSSFEDWYHENGMSRCIERWLTDECDDTFFEPVDDTLSTFHHETSVLDNLEIARLRNLKFKSDKHPPC